MKIYLDNASTTYPKPQVTDAMYRAIGVYANPSSTHSMGQKARSIIENSREEVAKLLNANEDEIFFTSGGSESDSWAIIGTALANRVKGNHIITTKIEHKAILNACKYLEENHNFIISYIDVDEFGIIKKEDLVNEIRPTTILISVMSVNNEIGSIQPLEYISEIAKENSILFHTDAVQAVGNLKLDVKQLGVDLLSISGHKFYGPKGIGALYIKKGTKIHSLIHGGSQENKKRAGTENIIAIAGLGKACELIRVDMEKHIEKIKGLKEYFSNLLLKEFGEKIIILGNNNTTANILGICIKYFSTDILLINFDRENIVISGGSACNAGALENSYVVKALGIERDFANGFLRFSFSDYNKKGFLQ